LRFLAFAGLSLGLKASRTVADISESLINRTLTKINQHEVCVYIPHYNQHPILLTHETLSESKTGSAPLGQARNTASNHNHRRAVGALPAHRQGGTGQGSQRQGRHRVFRHTQAHPPTAQPLNHKKMGQSIDRPISMLVCSLFCPYSSRTTL